MGQLTIYERGAVERARKILADIKADRSTTDYARHLARLEVTARTLLTIIENLTADGEDGKGAASRTPRQSAWLCLALEYYVLRKGTSPAHRTQSNL
jgi:hypothetical protein